MQITIVLMIMIILQVYRSVLISKRRGQQSENSENYKQESPSEGAHEKGNRQIQ